MPSTIAKKTRELDFLSLMIFKGVYESGQATTVADDLDISTSKVSRYLNGLRSVFDDELFYRRRIGLIPTPTAEKAYPLVCKFIESLTHLENIIQDNDETDSKTVLNLVISPVLIRGLALLVTAEQNKNKFGKIRLHLWGGDTANLLHKGDFDLGVYYGSPNFKQLPFEKVVDNIDICIVAKDIHPIWASLPHIALESICQHSFLFLSQKGFNEKIDPLEQFSRIHEIDIPDITSVDSREEWYAHLLTMNSIAFAPISELKNLNNTVGLRAEPLSTSEVSRLRNSSLGPKVYLVERPIEHRRYSNNDRETIVNLISRLFQ